MPLPKHFFSFLAHLKGVKIACLARHAILDSDVQFENFGASTKQSTVNGVDLFWEPFLKSVTLFATVEKLLLADTPALRSFCWQSTAIYIIPLRLLLAFYYHPIPPKLHNETSHSVA